MPDTNSPNIQQHQLENLLGLKGLELRINLSKKELFHEAIANDRGRVRLDGADDDQKAFPTKLGDDGPLVYYTDPTCTGRPVKDTFGVAWPEFEDSVWWKPDYQKFDGPKFEALLARVVTHLNDRGRHLYVKDVYCGSDPSYARPYRLVSEYAAHSLFCDNMFMHDIDGVQDEDGKRWTMLNVPSFHCDPERDGTVGTRLACLDFRNRICLVLGRADYCGVVKKSMFTVMNYLLPEMGEMSMHCSANVGQQDDGAILFGLSGTGKTTLSADPARKLIGDDEHAWTGIGVSNLEGGCYAKLINLDKVDEPVIAAAMSMAGTIIENVPPLPGRKMEELDPQELDLFDTSVTENTRFSYALECNPDVMPGAKGGHPKTIVLLTADAFGVLPPVSVLTPKEVMYHFTSGFTSKLAGTEVGITEPKAAFSACFGAPFMAQKPDVYARLLAEKMEQHETRCILLNTGWGGGPHGVGKRISIGHTRALLDAALNGDLDSVGFETHPVFGLQMPTSCPGVPAEILNPRNTWQDKEAYDVAAEKLRGMFHDNFEKKGLAEMGIDPVM
ncbi:MAG: phosphoenolpyruvate carboxykinase (ATP) [Planctomycetes bacterium]|jgi:phosphoenolpyruvate carboxykinase (ATP)|nr:phosphoenolpyruvate carboxykinase (ATP) [Planctomycetota bacterium]MBT4029049.1 phosphoenolpyruvate carboxykinase (ATP) [Planctomycetota bacterium]MBT4560331.1 phosphoenolpyruvate carboxykinase (ATP) [Planctomycetota bacterium]MBT5102205.1 phosphoenolpyruvate carboxykinase (ATP) [Planctomycetota bacterium]MBT5119586.1 phosphoenolpyruvate carboxykinase (ATP) [Planctomycetota bacterium]